MLKKLSSSLCKKPEVHVLIVGLDNSGKSSLIEQMKLKSKKGTAKNESKLQQTPTVGFQVEEFQYQNLALTCFDMSGQSRYRSLWEHYYNTIDAVIFVLDSSDRIRICVAKNEIEELLRHDDIAANPIPMVFFANKMDLHDAMTPAECSQMLELDRIKDRPWHVASCNARSGEGIADGVEWLASHISPASKRKDHKIYWEESMILMAFFVASVLHGYEAEKTVTIKKVCVHGKTTRENEKRTKWRYHQSWFAVIIDDRTNVSQHCRLRQALLVVLPEHGAREKIARARGLSNSA